MFTYINAPTPETTHVVALNAACAYCTIDTFTAVCDELVSKHGPGVPTVRLYTGPIPDPVVSPVEHKHTPATAPESPAKPVSDWDHQVSDEAAKARIEAQHAALNASGVVRVDAGQQFYAIGTRMADIGYSTQRERAREHEAKLPAHQAVAALARMVEAEGRHDVVTTAGELGRSVSVNGKLTACGVAMSEQAIRGLIARLKSPALGYVLGVRDRLAEESRKTNDKGEPREPNKAAMAADRAALADVLARECARRPDVEVKLRTRKAFGDCFAIVSPSYVSADAPDVLDELVGALPRDARASFSYDPKSTAWELRASVWTPTPTDEQAVGEPFEGYVSFSSRDNGTRSFRGGGGIMLIRCLNASTYTAEQRDIDRRHIGRIVADLAAMTKASLASIRALVNAWGAARGDELVYPASVRIQNAIPDFYTSMLADRGSVLVGTLPGRTKEHVRGLTAAFFAERRDADRLVRSDLAQGFTRYIQDQPADVRRDAEAAIGSWMVASPKLRPDFSGRSASAN